MIRQRALVVDTSVAVKWFFDEPGTPQAVEQFEEFRVGRTQVLAPGLIYSEFANAVWKRVVRGTLRAEDGTEVVEAFEQLPIEVTATRAIAAPAFDLAVRFSITVYDSMFVTLSQLTKADLLTADERLFRSVEQLGNVRLLTEWDRSR